MQQDKPCITTEKLRRIKHECPECLERAAEEKKRRRNSKNKRRKVSRELEQVLENLIILQWRTSPEIRLLRYAYRAEKL